MDETGSYVAAQQPGGLESEIERLRRQALQPWHKESRNLAWFGLQDGMSVLELGPGPGFVTEQLLKMLPKSKITLVERDPAMVERATAYLKDKADGRLQILHASVMDTGLPDNTFDFAIARLIFQHLPDPVGAARETLRVLKPGGKLVILDPDEKQHLWDPPAGPEIEAIHAKFMAAQAKKGNDRLIGRKLVRILKQAGFQNLDLETVVLHSDVLGIDEVFPKTGAGELQFAVDAGIITEDDLKLMMKDQEEFYSSEPIVMITEFMACGEKPNV